MGLAVFLQQYRNNLTTYVKVQNMAKLYWRVKKKGKWTWVAMDNENTHLAENILFYMEGDCECRDCE